MARQLNKSRMAVSRLIVVGVVLLVLFTYALIPVESAWHEFFDVLGIMLVSLCALGRLYTSAYLGGFKNDVLVTHGPFSVVRNPLYFFSLLGFTGVAFMTNHVFLMVAVPLGFILLYTALIKREENFLKDKFGAAYDDYMNRVPRLCPRLRGFHVPDQVILNTRFLDKAFKDALWWFAAFPLVEFVEFIQDAGWLRAFFLLP